MLGTIRDKASGWVAGIIVGALIISFAFWGVSSYFGGGDINVAKVNGIDINYQTFQQSFYRLRQQMQSVLGGNALSLEEEEFIKEQTLQQLVESELVNQLIKKNRLRVTDKTVVEKIKSLDFFKGEEGFDRLKYERAVSSLGMDPVVFEDQLRMDLLSEQLQAGLSETLFVLESELQSILQFKLQTRDITYATLSLDLYIDDSLDIEDAEVENYYKSNPSQFADPEKVKIAYLELDVNDLAETVEINEESLRDYYADNKDTYDVVEQRSVTKLYVNIAEEDADKKITKVSDEEKEKAKSVIESALALVNEGKTFEEIVETFSEEGRGALQFNETAYLTKGVQDEEIDEFLFSADEGDTSDVIESKTSFAIVKVGAIRGGPKNVYETVADQVEHDYKIAAAEQIFIDLSDTLVNLSYEHSDTLEVAADAIEKEIVETDFFSRDSETEGLLAKPQIVSNSFNQELIATGQNSEAIELSTNHLVVLKVIEHQDAKTKPLEDVREDVIAAIRLERAAEKISVVSNDIVKQLESGVSTENIETATELEWFSVEKTKRDNVDVNRSVLRNAFQVGTPGDKPIITSSRLGSGDYSIVIVTSVYDGELVEDEEAENLSDATDLELRRTRGTNEWQQFIKNAKGNADIQLFKENT
ncbi:MAG: SurA N-terminal domain-containing protein [Pseudomonadota bacterium]